MLLRPRLERLHGGVDRLALRDEVLVRDTALDAVCVRLLVVLDAKRARASAYARGDGAHMHSHFTRVRVHGDDSPREDVRDAGHRLAGAALVGVLDLGHGECVADDGDCLAVVCFGGLHHGEADTANIVRGLCETGGQQPGKRIIGEAAQ